MRDRYVEECCSQFRARRADSRSAHQRVVEGAFRVKAVFDTKAVSAYDDEITRQYHFPSRYLAIVQRCVGDWIVFREPRQGGGSMAYFAAAHVDRVDVDDQQPGLFYARLSGYLPFDRLVPWLEGGRYAEAAIRDLDRVTEIGAFLRGRSVREISDHDFLEIIARGFAETLNPENAARLGLEVDSNVLIKALGTQVEHSVQRRVVQVLVNRTLRDAAFRGSVCRAYVNQCAVTGLRIVNGGGRAEVQAAHIWSVADGGPDTVQNGLALSGTVHWLFDRYLISVADDYRILVNKERVPPELLPLIGGNAGRIFLPADDRLWPRKNYLATHRTKFLGKH